jgi:hypothetical protein
LYCDFILHSLSEAARRAFKAMRAFKYEYQNDFARQYFAQGRAEMVLRLLAMRFGHLDADSRYNGIPRRPRCDR